MKTFECQFLIPDNESGCRVENPDDTTCTECMIKFDSVKDLYAEYLADLEYGDERISVIAFMEIYTQDANQALYEYEHDL